MDNSKHIQNAIFDGRLYPARPSVPAILVWFESLRVQFFRQSNSAEFGLPIEASL